MSFSNPNQESAGVHPCSLWIEYRAKQKTFRMYDKDAIADDGSKGVKTDIGTNPMFIFLDSTFTISGYSERLSTTIYSNEMKIPKTKEAWETYVFHVKTGNKSWDVSGSWKEIKDLIDAKGGKLTINAYVAIKVNGVLRFACIQFNGASYKPWKDFEDKHSGTAIHSNVIRVVDHEYAKKGSNEFNTPVFDFLKSPLSEETIEACTQMDKALQDYLIAKTSEYSNSVSDRQEDPIRDVPVQIHEEPRMSIHKKPIREEYSDREMFGDEPPVRGDNAPSIDDLDEDLPF